ncbi:alcohol dehydrogenase catalytic domain-containing protein [Avibacterium sp. 20-15]|uniref:alcohol dehydrogenase catalytic domain-containing protein n=1 Tax=unclassified Avibacterium TaxID=2685287 RepID=UPI00202622CC|nr:MULTISPECIES: alcohol dehydrogenase catalytic domain-containing protein [unclassified Avibacterium]MCW9734106.1 alcohol dehydrogenase catalytic domain-containing protein [Avibacterium sp. 20-15]URL03752.1 alcohol dehydrogenase catalytic domain-containing protein [Avibacterium sp. 20-132]
MKNILTREEYLDISVLSEPLACVMHAYRRLPETLHIDVITILGAGPIGTLHALYAHRLYPLASIQMIEPDDTRRELIKGLLPFVSVFREYNSFDLSKSNLTVVATSCPKAQTSAIEVSSEYGIVILFSGINHKKKDELPIYEGQDLEHIHRNEEVVVISKNIRLIGSSGYHPAEIDLSLEELINHYHYYKVVQTEVVNGLGNNIIGNQTLLEPAIIKLLNDQNFSQNYLKVLFRHEPFPSRETRVIFTNNGVGLDYFNNLKPERGEVLVRILRSSICQTDRRVLQGLKNNDIKEGTILGHEGTGIIVSVGEGVNEELIGKTCAILPHYLAKEDSCNQIGMGYLSPDMKHLGIHINGCFATLATFPLCCIREHLHFIN